MFYYSITSIFMFVVFFFFFCFNQKTAYEMRISDGSSDVCSSDRYNANVALQYDFDAVGHPTFIRVDSIYVGEFYGDIYQSPATKAGDYVKIDLTSRIKFGQVALELYVQNLTNEDVYTFRGTSDTGRDFFGYRMRPRPIGRATTYDFLT